MMTAAKAWRREKRAAYLYRVLSDAESGSPRQLLFLELAQDADARAAQAAQTGQITPEKYTPDRRTRLTVWLIDKVGARHLPLWLRTFGLQGLEVFRSGDSPLPSAPTPTGASVWSKHPEAYVAAHDGLLSITLLVLVMAGATREYGVILLTGVAGMLLGGLTLAIFIYFAVRAQCVMAVRRKLSGPDDLAYYPHPEIRALALVYQARWLPGREALALAQQHIADTELDQDGEKNEITGSTAKPTAVATSSFFAFLLGGAVPLVPYLLGIRHYPLLASVALSGAGLFVTGAWLSWYQGREALWGGFRVLAIGALAGLMAYYTGELLGRQAYCKHQPDRLIAKKSMPGMPLLRHNFVSNMH